MLVANYSEFRSGLKQYLDTVEDDNETLIIKRNSKKASVLISLDEYNSLMETMYLLSSKTNEKRMDSAIDKLNSKQTFQKQLIEE
jgi:antitoxin YefM